MLDNVVKNNIGIWLVKNPTHHIHNHSFVIHEYITLGVPDQILHRLECLVRCDNFVTG